MVLRAEQQLLETITSFMVNREEFALGVGPRELLCEGRRLRTRQSVTRELAARLNRRGVSALTFLPEINRESIRLLLAWLAGQARSIPTNKSGAPEIAGFRIGLIPYDQLVLIDSIESNEEQLSSIWSALATAALSEGGVARAAVGCNSTNTRALRTFDVESLSAEKVVSAIHDGVCESGYAERISGMLFTLVDQAAHATPKLRASIGERLEAVLTNLDSDSLNAILAHIGSKEQQREFISQVSEALPVSAVVGWLDVAARSNNRGLSHHMLLLLRKLSTLATGAAVGSTADLGFRDAAQELVSGWELDDPNPGAHVELLDQIALIETDRSALHDSDSPADYVAEKSSEAERLVQMALEIDDVGEDTREAVQQLMMSGHAAKLLEWIGGSDGTSAATTMLAMASTPDNIMAILLRETPDLNVARVILGAAGEDAIPTMFDLLATSNVRMIRRIVYDRLREFGSVIWKDLASRLEDAPGFFARNLLALMRDIRVAERVAGNKIDSLTLTGVVRYLSHEREQVRLEAVRLMLDEPTTRSGTLRRALGDSSNRIAAEAIECLISQSLGPESLSSNSTTESNELFGRLKLIIADRNRSEETRSRAVMALATVRSVAVRNWLIEHVTRKRFLTRRTMLAEGKPTVVAAIGVLASRYANDDSTRIVLKLAATCRDARSVAVDVSRKQSAKNAS